MNNAVLYFRFRINGYYGLGEALEPINTGNQNISNATIMQISEHTEPMVSAFRFGQLEPKKLFFALNIET